MSEFRILSPVYKRSAWFAGVFCAKGGVWKRQYADWQLCGIEIQRIGALRNTNKAKGSIMSSVEVGQASSVSVVVRSLELNDLCEGTGFFETLNNLTPSPVLSAERAKKFFDFYAAFGKITLVAVEGEGGQIVGSVSYFAEPKLTRNGVFGVHFEEVVTRKGYEGLHVATTLMNRAKDDISSMEDRYKDLLDCSEDKVPFYERLGFRRHEVMMRRDVEPHAH